jgi:hypothetical protein
MIFMIHVDVVMYLFIDYIVIKFIIIWYLQPYFHIVIDLFIILIILFSIHTFDCFSLLGFITFCWFSLNLCT